MQQAPHDRLHAVVIPSMGRCMQLGKHIAATNAGMTGPIESTTENRLLGIDQALI